MHVLHNQAEAEHRSTGVFQRPVIQRHPSFWRRSSFKGRTDEICKKKKCYSCVNPRRNQRLLTGEFPTQRVSNAENVAILWRHHVLLTAPGAANTTALGATSSSNSVTIARTRRQPNYPNQLAPKRGSQSSFMFDPNPMWWANGDFTKYGQPVPRPDPTWGVGIAHYQHARDTFTPIAESGQFQPLRLGRGEGRVDHIL